MEKHNAQTMQDQLADLMATHCPEHAQAYQIGNLSHLQAAVCVLYHAYHTQPLVAENEIDATDAARQLAAENDIDLATVEGTGTDGRIIVADVQAAIEARA